MEKDNSFKTSWELRISVLVDNREQAPFACEHGLSLLIEHQGEKILLDAGKSERFLQNAKVLGIDLSKVDYGVLSHSHYDHANGLVHFFEVNESAPVYTSHLAGEHYYSMHDDGLAYIGPVAGLVTDGKYATRFVRVAESPFWLNASRSAFLLGHTTPDLSEVGKHAKLYKKVGEELQGDDFSHEMTLVLRTKKGLVIFNSCSHAGASNIVKEVRQFAPDDQIYAYIGGFHLFKSTDEEILEFAQSLKSAGVRCIVTGHCTGDHAFDLLKKVLIDEEKEPMPLLQQMHAGMVIEL